MQMTQIGSRRFARLDRLALSRSERLRIDAYIADGERAADLYCRAMARVQSGADRMARVAKALFAGPVRH